VTGYGMLNPAPFARYADFHGLSLGPFAEYKTVACWMIVVIGAAVALASLQRSTGGERRRKRAAPVVFAPVEMETEAGFAPLHSELSHAASDGQAEETPENIRDDHPAHAAEAEVQAREPAH